MASFVLLRVAEQWNFKNFTGPLTQLQRDLESILSSVKQLMWIFLYFCGFVLLRKTSRKRGVLFMVFTLSSWDFNFTNICFLVNILINIAPHAFDCIILLLLFTLVLIQMYWFFVDYFHFIPTALVIIFYFLIF